MISFQLDGVTSAVIIAGGTPSVATNVKFLLGSILDIKRSYCFDRTPDLSINSFMSFARDFRAICILATDITSKRKLEDRPTTVSRACTKGALIGLYT